MDVETLIEKSEKRDYKFFLEQENFLKVVDTLEKFEQGLEDTNTPQRREFTLFKRQLYKMHEIRARSVWEHEQFSFKVERNNLHTLTQANEQYCRTVAELNQEERLNNYRNKHLSEGAILQRKTLNPNRLKGFAAFASSFYAYNNLVYLNLYFGNTLPLFGVAASAMYGMFILAEKQTISLIEVVREGEYAGKVKIAVQDSPFVSHNIYANAKDIQSIVSVGEDDIGADDCEGNILWVKRYINESDGVENTQGGQFTIPADAFRDKPMLDWIFANKGENEETADDFNDLMVE